MSNYSSISVDKNNVMVGEKKIWFCQHGKIIIPKELLKKCIEFTWYMTFGEKGEHHATTFGTIPREELKIFENVLQGKIGEAAFVTAMYKETGIELPIDFKIMKKGGWDDFDLEYKPLNLLLSIKSTKPFGNLLLLESKNHDKNGYFVHGTNGNPVEYTHHIQTRVGVTINGKIEPLDKKIESILENDVPSFLALHIITDIPGYISSQSIKHASENGRNLVKKDSYISKYTRLKEDNMVFPVGGLDRISNFFQNINNKKLQ